MSNSFNGLFRLAADPELRFLPSGKAVLSFNGANSTGFGSNQKTLWCRVSYWNNPEKMKDFLKKGDQCYISGQLSQTEYTSNDGTKKTTLELNASFIDFVGKKQDPQSPPQAYPAQDGHSEAKANAYQPQTIDSTATKFDDLDDDIPFN